MDNILHLNVHHVHYTMFSTLNDGVGVLQTSVIIICSLDFLALSQHSVS